MKHTSKRVLLHKLTALYDKMAQAFAAATPQGFTCAGCSTNCCVSHFQHHTYMEWLYLWQGMNALPEERRALYLERARENVRLSSESLARGEIPRVMCPVNDDGACGLYEHRLMICRLYGVPNMLLAHTGVKEFPGCPSCMDMLKDLPDHAVVDRTPLYRELAGLEMSLLGSRRGQLPKVDLTLAQMLVAGPPKV
ncbi:hypothetical protein JCM15519_36770 [Fundidesulfovibrio butyratiphilus]